MAGYVQFIAGKQKIDYIYCHYFRVHRRPSLISHIHKKYTRHLSTGAIYHVLASLSRIRIQYTHRFILLLNSRLLIVPSFQALRRYLGGTEKKKTVCVLLALRGVQRGGRNIQLAQEVPFWDTDAEDLDPHLAWGGGVPGPRLPEHFGPAGLAGPSLTAAHQVLSEERAPEPGRQHVQVCSEAREQLLESRVVGAKISEGSSHEHSMGVKPKYVVVIWIQVCGFDEL